MGRISCKNNTANTKGIRAALLQLVRRNVRDLVLVRFWVAWENLFIAARLARYVFLAAEIRSLLVCHPVEPLVCDPSRHVEVVWVNDEARVGGQVRGEVVVDLVLSAP